MLLTLFLNIIGVLLLRVILNQNDVVNVVGYYQNESDVGTNRDEMKENGGMIIKVFGF